MLIISWGVSPSPLLRFWVANQLRRAGHALDATAAAALRPTGVTGPQGRALLFLGRYPDATMAELSRLASVSPQSMHRLVVGLERQGLVQRRRIAGDDKALGLSVTAEGADVVRRAEAVLAEIHDAVLGAFDDAELRRLLDVLERVEDACRRHARSLP